MTIRNVKLEELDNTKTGLKVNCMFLNILIDEVNKLNKEIKNLKTQADSAKSVS